MFRPWTIDDNERRSSACEGEVHLSQCPFLQRSPKGMGLCRYPGRNHSPLETHSNDRIKFLPPDMFRATDDQPTRSEIQVIPTLCDYPNTVGEILRSRKPRSHFSPILLRVHHNADRPDVAFPQLPNDRDYHCPEGFVFADGH